MSERQHIVVVDDEAPAREMVRDYLRLHGFEATLQAAKGAEVDVPLGRFHQLRPDVA